MQQTVDPIPKTNNKMRVVKDVVMLETGATRDIILREIKELFWQTCIDAVNTPKSRIRVAAVGTPGVGKTTSTPWLIRMLLEKGQTVVYVIRTDNESRWYYEFLPSGKVITVNVYPEKLQPDAIPSLKLPSSYYIVDPGETERKCTPVIDFLAKFIMVPSPDSGHWGGSKFEKERDDVCGEFRYFPTWSCEELLHARPILCPDMTNDQVCDRFRQVGGVPRHIFGKKINKVLQAQDRAIKAISPDIAKDIALGQEEAFDGFGRQTKSSVLAFRVSADDDGSYEEGESDIVSDLVVEKIYWKFKNDLWSVVLDLGPHGGGGAMFEMITRIMIANENPPREFECRRCVGKGGSDKATYEDIGCLKLGTGNKKIRHVTDPLKAAKQCANVVFHPISPTHKLFDLVYKDSAGHFHCFQATVSESRAANVAAIKKLERKVGNSSKLTLYFLVPSSKFPKFVTDPVNPKRNGGVYCQIYHVSIPNPRLQQMGAMLMNDEGEDLTENKIKCAAVANAATNEGDTQIGKKRRAAQANEGNQRRGEKRTKKSIT